VARLDYRVVEDRRSADQSHGTWRERIGRFRSGDSVDAGVVPPDIDKAASGGAPAPSGLSADQKLAYERLTFVYAKGIGYAHQMGLRPQTLYGINDRFSLGTAE
jgi:hypothetical protein